LPQINFTDRGSRGSGTLAKTVTDLCQDKAQLSEAGEEILSESEKQKKGSVENEQL